MDNSLKRVTIFIPTYKNIELILGCVSSCLSQTYNNIQIFVIDNGFIECGDSLKIELDKFNDQRIIYRPNPSNITHQGSFWLALSLANETSHFMVIPADCFLVTDCISKMIAAAEETPTANIVFASDIVRDIRHNPLTAKKTLADTALPRNYNLCGPMSATKGINYLFGWHNIDSNIDNFSYLGALIDSSLIRSIAMSRFPLRYHGGEELISLVILSYSDDIVIVDDALIIQYINAQRLGSATRPGSNFTRYEPLHAEYYYLDTYEPLLLSRSMLLSQLYLFVLLKTAYTMIRYPGPVYLLAPQAIGAFAKLVLCIIPLELGRFVVNKIFHFSLKSPRVLSNRD